MTEDRMGMDPVQWKLFTLLKEFKLTHTDGDLWSQGDNLIRFYIAQVPEDDPDSTPIFRMAEVLVNVDERNARLVLTPNDFALLE